MHSRSSLTIGAYFWGDKCLTLKFGPIHVWSRNSLWLIVVRSWWYYCTKRLNTIPPSKWRSTHVYFNHLTLNSDLQIWHVMLTLEYNSASSVNFWGINCVVCFGEVPYLPMLRSSYSKMTYRWLESIWRLLKKINFSNTWTEPLILATIHFQHVFKRYMYIYGINVCAWPGIEVPVL